MKSWTAEDVDDWLKSFKVEGFGERMAREAITGQTLPMLTTQDLRLLGFNRRQSALILSQIQHTAQLEVEFQQLMKTKSKDIETLC